MRSRTIAVVILAIICATAVYAEKSDFPEQQIQALLDSGDLETALEALDKRLKKRPRDAGALFLRSTAHIMAGDLVRGRADLEQSLSIDPKRRSGWLNRAALDLAQTDYERAIEAFSQAEALDPEAPDNSLNIGAALLLHGDRAAASERFRRYLEANDEDPGAFYLVAANYAMAGRGDLVVPLLKRSISLDENFRLRARTDANFASLANDPGYQALLNTDSYSPPADALTATRSYDIPFTGRDSRVLEATLTSLQLAGKPISPAVEVTEQWALIWSDVRIKVAANEHAGTDVIVTAAAGAYSTEAWSSTVEDLFRRVNLQLHSRRPGSASDYR